MQAAADGRITQKSTEDLEEAKEVQGGFNDCNVVNQKHPETIPTSVPNDLPKIAPKKIHLYIYNIYIYASFIAEV